MIYDITRTVSPTTAVFPGDTPYQAVPLLRISDGASVNLVTITTTPHVGTHADAPYHYLPAGRHPSQLALEPYIGQAQVISVANSSGEITLEDVGEAHLVAGVPRILIHTCASEWADDVWRTDFPYPSVALIEALAARGILLIGLDVPSFDHADSTLLPGHQALGRHQIMNLENLCLRDVPDGVYDLSALPLKLDLACASPVRAVLRTLD